MCLVFENELRNFGGDEVWVIYSLTRELAPTSEQFITMCLFVTAEMLFGI